MRGQSLVGLLAYEAKRKPEVQALVDRVHEMTEAELDAVDVPLPWYRNALRALRQEKRLELAVTYGTVEDPKGYTAEWDQEYIFIRVSDGMSMEIGPGTFMFFPESGGVWIGSTFSKTVDPRFTNLPQIETMTRTAYIAAYKARLLKLV